MFKIREIYRDSWRQPEEVTDLVYKFIKSPSLNICCGMSKIGDIRADITLTVKPNILCDMFHLPFKPISFNSVYCDPPWNIPYDKRISLTKKLYHLLKPDGVMIFSAPWIPKMKGLHIEQIYLIDQHFFHQNINCVTISRRINKTII
jgi:16S rRNA G966 N2-methylase RsmD